MKTIFNITGAVALTALATTANAASFSLSGAPASVNVGDTFDVTVSGDFGGDFMLTVSAALGFDPAIFSVVGATLDFPAAPIGFPIIGTNETDPALTCLGGTVYGACPGDGAGQAGVGLGNFGYIQSWFGGSVDLAIATFTLSADAASAGSVINVGADPVNLPTTSFSAGDGLLDGIAGDSATVEVLGGAVVPVPAAVWLFGSGLLGLVGVARRKA